MPAGALAQMTIPLIQTAIILVTCIAAATAALMLLAALQVRKTSGPRLTDLPAGMEPAIFLFDGTELVDATPPALRLVGAAGGDGGDGDSEWSRLCAWLSPRFGGVETALSDLPATGRVEMTSAGQKGLGLIGESFGRLTRITINDHDAEGQGMVVDSLAQRALEEELADLRGLATSLPVPVWRQQPDGTIDWANGAYLAALAEFRGAAAGPAWPFPALFDAEALRGRAGARLSLPRADGRGTAWFDVEVRAAGDAHFCFATPSDATVKAEASLREFVQTLGKTFAHLPIGLAIFDRQRQLALFNPALIDLTGLGADFLIARPTLFALLDRLRDMRMIPEQKNYTGWRQQMADLERAASSGFHQETWTLPTGQTYRVTGRPHPEGALAFLVEDISAEISLTRRFRAEIETAQEIVDLLPDAIAVFSPAGVLLQANAAFARLWGLDPAASLGAITVREAAHSWQALAQPNPAWLEARDFVGLMGPRSEWTAEARMRDGRALACRFVPMTGGATMIVFREATAPAAAERRPLKVRRSASLLAEEKEPEDA